TQTGRKDVSPPLTPAPGGRSIFPTLRSDPNCQIQRYARLALAPSSQRQPGSFTHPAANLTARFPGEPSIIPPTPAAVKGVRTDRCRSVREGPQGYRNRFRVSTPGRPVALDPFPGLHFRA